MTETSAGVNFEPGQARYVNLATFRKSGAEVRTPVWIAEYNGLYYVFSESKAGKIKRIRNNNRVRLAACDVRGKVQSGWVDGRARIVDDQTEIDAMYAAFSRKYGWQMALGNFFARLSGRYDKRAIIAISIP